MKFLIFGSGQLGGAFEQFLKAGGDAVSVASGVDIRALDQVVGAIAGTTPDVVLNCAAKTNLDWCEQHQLECFDTNTLGADTVARACEAAGTYLVHVSTGCIQESKVPEDAHREDDPPTPTSFYSWTKYWADQLIENRARAGRLRALIVRPRQPVSAEVSPRNALVKMLTYQKFIDTPNSVTVVEDFLPATRQLVEQQQTGVFNVCNPGVTSPYQMALLLKEIVEPELTVTKISKDELNAMTFARRIDSVLNTDKLASAGIVLKPIDVRLREVIAELKENLGASHAGLDQAKIETEKKLALKHVA